uniref:AlNc14C414G11479 protein n=1 Tax=Albugo laibachii Nc14 TaxID=890382 RepID=F0WZ73_9STRA|nr:AlNc14C414G11479 [Albugo laibachii Nc14]|eukprot:CCA26789.1 AlNc14C414G11479 [Albugo laibachii Nc14]
MESVDLFIKYGDILLVEFAADPPVKVTPLQVIFKEGFTPFMAKSRRYPPLHRDYLDKRLADLMRHYLLYHNPDSRWERPRVLSYDGGITGDKCSNRSDGMANATSGSSSGEFGRIKIRNYFTVVPPNGIFTAYRVIMGSSDAVAYALKIRFLSEGINHCASHVQGFCELEPPETEAELEQFLCAVNGTRNNIPNYTTLVKDLQDVLQYATESAGSRKKRNFMNVLLQDHGWSSKHDAGLQLIKGVLSAMVPMAHPKDTWDMCLYTDASQDHWGAIITQVEPGALSKPRAEQNHFPLASVSELFKGSMLNGRRLKKKRLL